MGEFKEDNRFSRRIFLVGTAKIAGGLAATGSGIEAVRQTIKLAASSPPGSGPALLDSRWGLAPHLRNYITTSPKVHAISKGMAGHIYSNAENRYTPNLGDEIEYAINLASEILYPGQIITVQDRLKRAEIVRAGIGVYAALTSTWYIPKQLMELGYPAEILNTLSPYYSGTKEFFWREKGVGRYFPEILAMEGEDPSLKAPTFGGQDGPLHFGTHLFFTFAYADSKFKGTEDYKRIPYFLRLLVEIGKARRSITNDIEEAGFASITAGEVYEHLNLFNPSFNPLKGNYYPLKGENFPYPGNIPGEGRFDPSVKADFGSNRLGVFTAAAFWRKILTEESFDPIYKILNDPRIKDYPDGLELIRELSQI